MARTHVMYAVTDGACQTISPRENWYSRGATSAAVPPIVLWGNAGLGKRALYIVMWGTQD